MSKTDSTYKANDATQAELYDFETEADSGAESETTDDGDSDPVTEFSDYSADDSDNKCLTCESEASNMFLRVYSDNDGDLYACPSCSTRRERSKGATIRPVSDGNSGGEI